MNNDPFLTHARPISAAASRPVNSDPFMSHTPPAQEPPPQSRQQEPPPQSRQQDENPFQMHSPTPFNMHDELVNDPFLTHQMKVEATAKANAPVAPRREPPKAKATSADLTDLNLNPLLTGGNRWAKERRFAKMPKLPDRDDLYNFIGSGDDNREKWTGWMYMMLPFLLYLYVVLLWMIMKHWWPGFPVLATILTLVVCLVVIFIGEFGHKYGSLSFTALGTLCFFSVCAGWCVGSYGYHDFSRPYWWMEVGQVYDLVTASLDPSAVSDAAILNFYSNETSDPASDTSVDTSRSAGYKYGGYYYCVAPYLDRDMAASDDITVSFWSVGIGCCDLFGNFDCDDVAYEDAFVGVVQLENGFPHPGSNQKMFERAVSKAEYKWNMKSKSSKMFVRTVKVAGEVKAWLFFCILFYFLVCAFIVFLFLAVIAWATNYYGWGRSSLSVIVKQTGFV